MYKDVLNNLESQLTEEEFIAIKDKNFHLAVFSEPYLTYLLLGVKKIEARFNATKIAPYNQITKDDIVIIKKANGNVVAFFTIKDVLFLDLVITPISSIKNKYGKFICVDDKFWESKKNSNYATLILIDEFVKLKPFYLYKRTLQTWIKLDK